LRSSVLNLRSAIALARQLRPNGIVAVEPDPANFALLQQNLRLAGLTERCKAIQAFAGAERGFAELIDSGNGAWGIYLYASSRNTIAGNLIGTNAAGTAALANGYYDIVIFGGSANNRIGTNGDGIADLV